MIHSVFELGDTIVREVMVPRTDMVFIEEHKTLRQAVSLALRSGFSRIPVIRDGLDDVVGVLYLKDVIKRVYDSAGGADRRAGRLDDAQAVCGVRTPSRSTSCCARCSSSACTWSSWWTSSGAPPGWSRIEDILEEIVGEIMDEYDEESHSHPARRGPIPGVVPVADRRAGRAVRAGAGRRGGGDRRRADGQAAEQGADRRVGRDLRRPGAGGGAGRRAAEQDRHGAGDPGRVADVGDEETGPTPRPRSLPRATGTRRGDERLPAEAARPRSADVRPPRHRDRAGGTVRRTRRSSTLARAAWARTSAPAGGLRAGHRRPDLLRGRRGA